MGWLKDMWDGPKWTPTKPECEHIWSKWAPWSSGLYWQRRSCTKCGFTQEQKI